MTAPEPSGALAVAAFRYLHGVDVTSQTPDGRLRDPEHEARAQAWDDEVEAVAEGQYVTERADDLVPQNMARWEWRNPADCYIDRDKRRHAAAAAIATLDAHRAESGPWEWGVRATFAVIGERTYGPKRTREAAEALRAAGEFDTGVAGEVVRRRPAGPWEVA